MSALYCISGLPRHCVQYWSPIAKKNQNNKFKVQQPRLSQVLKNVDEIRDWFAVDPPLLRDC